MASSYNKFNCFVGDLANGKHDLASDALKVLLTNTAPVATDAVKADLTEIGAGNGYSAGGVALAGVADTDASGTVTLSGTVPGVTASGGPIGPLRYAVLYNATASGNPLIGWWDYGSSITLASGETLTITLSSGAFTLA